MHLEKFLLVFERHPTFIQISWILNAYFLEWEEPCVVGKACVVGPPTTQAFPK